MEKSALRSFLSVIAVLCLFAACNNPKAVPVAPFGNGQAAAPAPAPVPTPSPGTTTTGKVYRFAFIPKSLDIPVFGYAKTGAERQAAQYGNVKILWEAPASVNAQQQKEILDRFIADKVDGIAISCINGELLTPSINRAVERGIPVITWDSDAPNSKRTAFYGLNDYDAGVKMGEEVVRLFGAQGGQVAALTTGGADNLQKRINGFQSVIRNYPIKLVEAFDVQDDASTAAKVVASATRTYPNLRAWISVGGWPAFNSDITASIDPAKTYMITFDTIPVAWDLIKSGKIHMALGQKYFGWGSAPTRLLYDIVVNHQYPPSTFVDSGVDIVTKDNIAEYIKKWEQMEKGQIVE